MPRTNDTIEIENINHPGHVQLDLEAKGTILRETSRPLRWHKV